MKDYIDCIFLPYMGVNYLLPSIAICELVGSDVHQRLKLNAQETFHYLWRECELPLVTWDLKPIEAISVHNKVAVMNALFTTDRFRHHYFAVLFDGKPNKIRVKPQSIEWRDETARSVEIQKEDNTTLQAIMPELKQFSQKIETIS